LNEVKVKRKKRGSFNSETPHSNTVKRKKKQRRRVPMKNTCHKTKYGKSKYAKRRSRKKKRKKVTSEIRKGHISYYARAMNRGEP